MDHDLDEHHDTTRRTLHRVATHVLARAQFIAIGTLGLRATPGGFATTTMGPDRERIRVSGGTLLRESAAPSGNWTRSMPIDASTLRDLAEFADVLLSDEFSAGHDTPAVGDIDEPLLLDTASTRRIGDWFSIVTQSLDRLVHTAPDFGSPSLVQLWPEHFDAALDIAFDPAAPKERRANIGGSPGDGFHSAPYLYVGPWTPDRPGDAAFWNAPFGAVIGYDAVATSPDPIAMAHEFMRTGLELLST